MDAPPISVRKQQHLEVARGDDAEAYTDATWEDVRLIHDALPEVDLDEVDTSVRLLGRRLALPLVIAGMTGGHPDGSAVNAVLARAAERHGVAMGLGSQRAALVDARLEGTYSIARAEAPSAFLIGNIGAAQLIRQGTEPPLRLDALQSAVALIRADAMAVHLNFLEEAIQTEGNRASRGCAEAIATLAAALDVPLIAKETGAGISRSTALRLRALGVAGLDVGGAGGTSFAKIELARARQAGDPRGVRLGALLERWGIPTPVSVIAASTTGLDIVATGGVRSGLDAARALALGATAVGVARPLLLAALEGEAAVDRWLDRFSEELRTVMMLTGSTNVAELRERQRSITGATRRWLTDLEYA